MVVYGDLLFFINFSMDFLCFYISCLLLHQKLPIFRTCLASFVGGVYSVLALFLTFDGAKATAIDVLVLVLMCLVVYCGKETKFIKIVKGIFLYFFVSALLGGLMTALFSLFNRIELLASNSELDDGINVWIFVLLVIVASMCTLGGGRVFRSSSSKKEAQLTIESEFGEVKLRALVDSGNLAYEPISGKAVVFVSVEKCKKIIEKSLYDSLNNRSNVDEMPIHILSKIRMIPTRSVSGERIFYATKFKKVTVKIGKMKKEIDVYIALIQDDYLGEYDAIISHETIV